ncbi:protein AF1q isoform A [Alligator mississippiensis]|uniref:Protein AF1q isoform A n=1 Tax=Alligator mississippiensis TaxID=8496 RepID=A0A151M565_ALLMI|nr:protein AF1q isoform A [Alligator mississippiensis]
MPIPELDLSELEGLGLADMAIYKPKGGLGKLSGDRHQLRKDSSEEDRSEVSEQDLILPQTVNTRCHAVLDVQMLEKQQMGKELEQEKHLAKKMEMEHQKAIQMQKQLQQKRKQELIRWPCRGPAGKGSRDQRGTRVSPRGKHQLKDQIKNNKERAIQAKLQDLEAQEIRDHLQQLHLEELRDLEHKWQHKMKPMQRISKSTRKC